MTDSPNGPLDDGEDSTVESGPEAGIPDGESWVVVSQSHFDATEPDSLTVTIVEAVAEAEGVPPTAVLDPPLYESADTVELEATLFGGEGDEDVGPDEGSVEFMYRGYRVVVRRDGWVLVHAREER